MKKLSAPLYTQPWDLEVPLAKQSASPREGLEEAAYLPPATSFLGFFPGTQHPPPPDMGAGGVLGSRRLGTDGLSMKGWDQGLG